MTSLRQIEANRLNALRSTGPRTEEGKLRSRRNAVRHGLTAETVITGLEDREDYEAFQDSVISDYDATSAVERELVLRLASILWRLRRASAIETMLFGSAARDSCRQKTLKAAKVSLPEKLGFQMDDIAKNFLCLNDLPTCPLDRLSRYEQRLWRQARQIILTLKINRRTSLFTVRRPSI